MGGLACALALAKKGFKHIGVYETASNLGFVGAGIQLAPNMARILDRLGCWADIEKEAVDLKDTSIRRKISMAIKNPDINDNRGRRGQRISSRRPEIYQRDVRISSYGRTPILSSGLIIQSLQTRKEHSFPLLNRSRASRDLVT
jgi:hypothetical protein